MSKLRFVALLLMTIVTVIYASVIVYAYANSSLSGNPDGDLRGVVYAAFEYKSDIPPPVWYTPEELGIVGIIELGKEGGAVQIVVDREKEPFSLQKEQPVFLYKDKFYGVSSRWVTFFPLENDKQLQILIGVLLGAGWVLTGVLFFKERKNRKSNASKLV